jgi:uncharacterized protein (DUF1330 family)
MPATQPRPDQFEQFLANKGEGPIHMLNLLKFKPRAQYADGRETKLSGAEAYGLYGVGVAKLLAELGGSIEFGAQARSLVIGDGGLEWDSVAIVRYPSFDAFVSMTQSEAYRAIHVHRDAGLAHQLLIHCVVPS